MQKIGEACELPPWLPSPSFNVSNKACAVAIFVSLSRMSWKRRRAGRKSGTLVLPRDNVTCVRQDYFVIEFRRMIFHHSSIFVPIFLAWFLCSMAVFLNYTTWPMRNVSGLQRWRISSHAMNAKITRYLSPHYKYRHSPGERQRLCPFINTLYR